MLRPRKQVDVKSSFLREIRHNSKIFSFSSQGQDNPFFLLQILENQILKVRKNPIIITQESGTVSYFTKQV